MSKRVEQLTVFNYVKCDVHYIKQHITLKALAVQLSEKRRDVGAQLQGKNHSISDFTSLDNTERQRR